MAGERVTRKIGLLGRVATGKTPSTFDPANFGGPYPFITIPDLDGRVFIDRTERTLSERGAVGMQGCLLPSGAVMMSCIATVGKCGITAKPSFTNQQINSVIPDNRIIDSRFLYYVFTQLGHELESAGGGGSVYTNVSKSRFSNIEISFPEDISEQSAIANILGTLDDKIELNRRMNETLEAMARALFKSWFVDFDPVRAKMEGYWKRGQSLPGLPAHLYDLFPARLVDSELGEILEGWEVVSFGEIVEQLRENENPFSSPATRFLHFSIPAFDEGQWPKVEFGEEIKSQKSRVPPGVVLLSKLNPEIERVWLVDVQEADRAICSTEFLVFRPRSPYGRSYVYCATRSQNLRQGIESLVTGTSKSHQRAQANAILGLAVVKAPDPLVRAFERMAAPLLERTLECRRESHTLAALRDALLPKLISGELQVKDAEHIIGRTAT